MKVSGCREIMASGRGLPAGRKHPWMTKHPGCLQRLIMRFAVHAAWSSPAGTHSHNVGACSGQVREGPGVLRGTLAPRIHTVARRTAYLCSRMPCRIRHRLQQQPLIQQLPPQSTGLAPWYRECFVVLRAIRLPQPTQERRVPWQRLGRSRPQLRRHAPRIFSSLPENQLRAACR